MKLWSASALGLVALFALISIPAGTDALGHKKLKILGLIGGAAGAGGFVGALVGSHLKRRQPEHHVKHIHYHPVHAVKLHSGWDHGWDQGWDEGWDSKWHGASLSYGGWDNAGWW